MQPSAKSSPVILCIMDGWGLRDSTSANAVAMAATPAYDSLLSRWPHAKLAASGVDVGLPEDQVGNSEVGHMNIGAGRIVMQDLPRINAALADGSLAGHPELASLASKIGPAGRIHVMGLMSSGGVHSHSGQMLAVISGLAAQGAEVIVHGFTDGRDVLPRSAGDELPRFLAALPSGVRFGTLIGRYYAMDRDRRWDRTRSAYAAITSGVSAQPMAASPVAALEAAYETGESDEFVTPRVIAGYDGMKDGDAIVMINFRADRVRQLLSCWLGPEEAGGDPLLAPPRLAGAVGMTSYSSRLDARMTTLFGPQQLTDTLGEVVAAAGRRQLRLAETEKYPHVTFFLNGGEESQAEGEERVMIPRRRLPLTT